MYPAFPPFEPRPPDRSDELLNSLHALLLAAEAIKKGREDGTNQFAYRIERLALQYGKSLNQTVAKISKALDMPLRELLETIAYGESRQPAASPRTSRIDKNGKTISSEPIGYPFPDIKPGRYTYLRAKGAKPDPVLIEEQPGGEIIVRHRNKRLAVPLNKIKLGTFTPDKS